MRISELFLSKKELEKKKKDLMADAGGAGGGGGAGAGGGAGSGAGAGTGGGAGPGNGSGAGSFGDSSGGGGSAGSGDTGSSDSTPTPARGYAFLGSMPSSTKKKKKKKKAFKVGQGIYEATEENLEAMETNLSVALGMARDATKLIKYDDTVNQILVKISGIAEDVGIAESELDYYERQIFSASNNLESAIYEIEEVFEDKLRNVRNALDELRYEDE
jgi:hypothetical protein